VRKLGWASESFEGRAILSELENDGCSVIEHYCEDVGRTRREILCADIKNPLLRAWIEAKRSVWIVCIDESSFFLSQSYIKGSCFFPRDIIYALANRPGWDPAHRQDNSRRRSWATPQPADRHGRDRRSAEAE